MKEHYCTKNEFSVLRSILWMLFLAVGIQIILGFIAAAVFGSLGLKNNEIEQQFMRPDTIAIIGVIAAILSIPLIKKTSNLKENTSLLTFLGIQWAERVTLVRVLLIGVGFYLFNSLLTYALSINTPQFMLDVKAQTNTVFDLLMLVIGVCIVAPIIEEIIFRGHAYSRLIKSRAGITGTIIITSLVFTIIHTQYETIVLLTLLPFAFLLGYVRYKTGNLVYCIALHIQLNIFSTIELFVFL
ncbi:CPBP family intramembrane glutamic endopeptidase [Colwellia sp. RSH04]|uniref:CPBP family intramembrane glutamic endopeptidase n=1 Tax=Colwellia sp. RSH04 TaxID=2305464 RepID=UPI000E5702C4|nr:CPBP family intramembrane glutamic endopeptidase [Colwellia sp. RSH04]RHW75539.1 CPBP family intramembrane metalloprotease [Colwellia sp. RSH04]